MLDTQYTYQFLTNGNLKPLQFPSNEVYSLSFMDVALDGVESDSLASPSPEVQQNCTLLQGWHGFSRY